MTQHSESPPSTGWWALSLIVGAAASVAMYVVLPDVVAFIASQLNRVNLSLTPSVHSGVALMAGVLVSLVVLWFDPIRRYQRLAAAAFGVAGFSAAIPTVRLAIAEDVNFALVGGGAAAAAVFLAFAAYCLWLDFRTRSGTAASPTPTSLLPSPPCAQADTYVHLGVPHALALDTAAKLGAAEERLRRIEADHQQRTASGTGGKVSGAPATPEGDYLRQQLHEAAASYDRQKLKPLLARLREVEPQSQGTWYYDLYLAFLEHLAPFPIDEREAREQRARRAMHDLKQYLSEYPSDPAAWLLQAMFLQAARPKGWFSGCTEALSAAISLRPSDHALRFYRGELIVRTMPPDRPRMRELRMALEDLQAYLCRNLDHARGYRVLSDGHLLMAGVDNASSATHREAAQVAAAVADAVDGYWRARYRPLASWTALASAMMLGAGGTAGFLELRAGGALCFAGGACMLYALMLAIWTVPTASSSTPMFWIESKTDYRYDEQSRPQWLERVCPRPPNSLRLRDRLDALHRDLGIPSGRE